MGETRAAWRQTMAFGFGPAMDLRTMSDVDFGTSVGKVEAVVAGTEPVTAETVAQLGANARGLGRSSSCCSARTPARSRRRRPPACQSVSAASALVAGAADEVLAGWTSGAEPYAEALDDDDAGVAQRPLQRGHPHPAGGRRSESGHRPGGPQRRARAGGRRPRAGPPRPRRHARRPRGGHGQLRGVLEPGIARQSADAASRTRAELTAGIDSLSAVTGPLAAAVADDPDGLTAAQEPEAAKRTLATEVVSLLRPQLHVQRCRRRTATAAAPAGGGAGPGRRGDRDLCRPAPALVGVVGGRVGRRGGPAPQQSCRLGRVDLRLRRPRRARQGVRPRRAGSSGGHQPGPGSRERRQRRGLAHRDRAGRGGAGRQRGDALGPGRGGGLAGRRSASGGQRPGPEPARAWRPSGSSTPCPPGTCPASW